MTKTKQEIINETMTVDKFVKQKCKEKGVSLKQMCDDLKIPYNPFKSNYHAKRMKYARAIKIASYLNCNLGDLLAKPTKAELEQLIDSGEWKG